jgi:hypothetical protein
MDEKIRIVLRGHACIDRPQQLHHRRHRCRIALCKAYPLQAQVGDKR